MDRAADFESACGGSIPPGAIHKGLQRRRWSSRLIPPSSSSRGDERRIRQVVFNLLSSAVKFTPEGGRVDVSTAQQDGELGQGSIFRSRFRWSRRGSTTAGAPSKSPCYWASSARGRSLTILLEGLTTETAASVSSRAPSVHTETQA